MQRQTIIRHRKFLKKPVDQHRLGTRTAFLSRLSDEYQRAAPLRFEIGQHACRAGPARHVHIMRAGMHRRHCFALIIRGRACAGKWQTRRLLYRQRVGICSYQHRWPLSILQYTYYSVSTHILCDLETKRLQFSSQPLASLLLLK